MSRSICYRCPNDAAWVVETADRRATTRHGCICCDACRRIAIRWCSVNDSGATCTPLAGAAQQLDLFGVAGATTGGGAGR